MAGSHERESEEHGEAHARQRRPGGVGWNIDPNTGQQAPGLNSRPEHIELAVEGMLKRLRTDRTLEHIERMTGL